MEQKEEIKAVLVGVDLGISEKEAENSLEELEKLAQSAGLSVSGLVLQRRSSPEAATFIGRGKDVYKRQL